MFLKNLRYTFTTRILDVAFQNLYYGNLDINGNLFFLILSFVDSYLKGEFYNAVIGRPNLPLH